MSRGSRRCRVLAQEDNDQGQRFNSVADVLWIEVRHVPNFVTRTLARLSRLGGAVVRNVAQVLR